MGDPVGPGRVDGAAPPVLAADALTRVGAAPGAVAAAAVLVVTELRVLPIFGVLSTQH